MIISILGPPGSGKGTVAKELSKKLRIPTIRTGELLRKEIANTKTGINAEIPAISRLVATRVLGREVK